MSETLKRPAALVDSNASSRGNIVSPSDDEFLILAASYARKAEVDEASGSTHLADTSRAKARANIQSFLKRRPHWTLAKPEKITPLQIEDDLRHYIHGLRLAGLPD